MNLETVPVGFPIVPKSLGKVCQRISNAGVSYGYGYLIWHTTVCDGVSMNRLFGHYLLKTVGSVSSALTHYMPCEMIASFFIPLFDFCELAVPLSSPSALISSTLSWLHSPEFFGNQ